MHKGGIKIVSLILLAVVLFLFTGLSSLLAKPALNAPVKACCDACSKEKARSTNACSTPDCPLYLCLTAKTASPVSILSPETVGSASSSIAIHSPYSEVKSIFHPPALI